MSNFKTILESKIGSDITKLGEDTLTKLSQLALSDEQFTEISSKLLGITEAENNPTIIGKNKDAWHKAEFKSVLDSFDSSLQGHEGIIEVMPTNTKDKVKEVLKSYKTKYESLQRENADLTQKAKEGFSDAELKALLKAKEEEVSILKTTHIPKDSVKEYENQVADYKREIEAFKKAKVKDTIILAAKSTGILTDIPAEFADDIVYAATKKYLENEEFNVGGQAVKAKIIIDPKTKQVVIRNASDESLAVTSNGQILTIDKLVEDVIVKSNLNKKSQQQQPTIVIPPPPTQNNKVQTFDSKYF